jgi:hypothetical protein
MTRTPTFVNWDNRPAVLCGDQAFAILRPGGGWKSVDSFDVGQTSALMDPAAWHQFFFGRRRTMAPDVIKALLPNLPPATIDGQMMRRAYRAMHPRLTEAELDLMAAAEQKEGHPPRSIGYALDVLLGRPHPTEKDFDDAARVVAAEHRKHQAAAMMKEPVSKKTYDPDEVENRDMRSMFAKLRLERKAEAQAIYDLDNSPDETENRKIIETLRRIQARRAEKAKAVAIDILSSSSAFVEHVPLAPD